MRRFSGPDEERNKHFPAVPCTSGPNPNTEDWTLVDVTVRKGQQRFNRRVKDLQNTRLFLCTSSLCTWCLYSWSS